MNRRPIQTRTTTGIATWRVLLPVGLGTALSLMGDATLYAVLPTHTADAGVMVASVGVLLSANRWIRLVSNGLAGRAYDRWPRRWLFVPALFLGAISTALYAFTQGYWPLLVGRLLWGIAWSGIWVGGTTILLDVTTDADRGRWTGLYQLAFYGGATLGSVAGGILTDTVGYHFAVTAAACITLLGALIALLGLPETRHAREEGARMKDEPRSFPLSSFNLHPSLWPPILLYSANRFVLAGVISTTLGLWLQQRWGSTAVAIATLTGTLLGISTVISMVAAPLAGRWSDRMANRWRSVVWGLLPGIVGFGLLAAGAPMAILLGVPLVAAAGGSSQSLATTLLGDTATPEARGRAIGWMHTAGDFASAIAPLIAYEMAARVGLAPVYVACAVLLGVMMLWAAQRM
ncbi:MAG: MFS transporter [Anaerolineales bacterium]